MNGDAQDRQLDELLQSVQLDRVTVQWVQLLFVEFGYIPRGQAQEAPESEKEPTVLQLVQVVEEF